MSQQRRYSLDDLIAQSAVLTIEGREYPIPDSLTIPMMAKFMLMSKQIEGADDDPEQAVFAMNAAHDAILEYVRVKTPDANFQLGVEQIVGAIAFIVGNKDGAEAEVLEQLNRAGADTDSSDGVRLDDAEGPPSP